MKNQGSAKNNNSIVAFIFILAGYALLIIAVILWIPRSNLPRKQSASSSIADGTIRKGNLWNFYKEKTKSEVKMIIPSSFDTGSGFMVVDQYGDDERSAMLEIVYDGEAFDSIALILENNSSICGTKNAEDLEKLSSFADWSLDRFGLSLSDMKKINLDNYIVFSNSEGVQCGYSKCPKDGIPMFVCSYDDALSDSSNRNAFLSNGNNSPKQIPGSLHYGNLWKYYYGKSISEVREKAPVFDSMGDGIYRLDSGYMDEDEKKYPAELLGTFENGKLTQLGLGTSGMGNLCAIYGNNRINQTDFELINAFALWCLDLFGLVTSDDLAAGRFSIDEKFISATDDYEAFLYKTPSGVLCTTYTCPGTSMVFSCVSRY